MTEPVTFFAPDRLRAHYESGVAVFFALAKPAFENFEATVALNMQTARAAKPDDPAIADSWGWLQYRLGHLDQAEKTLRDAWQTRKDADVGVHLGEVLWKQGRQSDAQRVFEEVRRIDPKSETLRDTLKRLNP